MPETPETPERSLASPPSVHDFATEDKLQDDKVGVAGLSSEKLSDESETPLNNKQISWDGVDDKRNPKNWPRRRKIMATTIVSLYALTTSASASAVAPALPDLQRDLHIASATGAYLIFSMPAFGFIIGSLPFGPLSELYGRTRVLQWSFAIFLAFNIGCGFVTNETQMYVLRFFNGVAGSAPATIGAGTVADCYDSADIGRGSAFYGLAPRLGPALGPLVSGFIIQYLDWRWTFYISSMVSGAILLASFLFIEESRADVILRRKCQRLQKETGDETLHTATWPPLPDPETGKIRGTPLKIMDSLTRPLLFLGQHHILQYLAVYQAYLTGILYLVLSNYHALWTDIYHEPVSIAGLNYVSIGLGLILGNTMTTYLSDWLYRYLLRRSGLLHIDERGKLTPADDQPHPELRVPLMLLGAIILPSGILLYGWSAHYKTFWLVPNIGTFLIAVGIIVGTQGIKLYTIDTYQTLAASATGAINLCRSVGSAVLPLCAPSMIASLGYGWSNTLLAGIAVLLGIPGPVLLWFYGARMRRRASIDVERASIASR